MDIHDLLNLSLHWNREWLRAVPKRLNFIPRKSNWQLRSITNVSLFFYFGEMSVRYSKKHFAEALNFYFSGSSKLTWFEVYL